MSGTFAARSTRVPRAPLTKLAPTKDSSRMKSRLPRRATICSALVVGSLATAGVADALQLGDASADAESRAVLLREINIALTGRETAGLAFSSEGACTVTRVRDPGAENESIEVFHLDRLPADGVRIDTRHGNEKYVSGTAVVLRLHGHGIVYESRYPQRQHRDAASRNFHAEIPAAELGRVREAWRFLSEHGCRYGGTPPLASG
jgi:hypothetical protein